MTDRLIVRVVGIRQATRAKERIDKLRSLERVRLSITFFFLSSDAQPIGIYEMGSSIQPSWALATGFGALRAGRRPLFIGWLLPLITQRSCCVYFGMHNTFAREKGGCRVTSMYHACLSNGS